MFYLFILETKNNVGINCTSSFFKSQVDDSQDPSS